jgi:alkanesulfonate monooxygenase
MNCWPFASAASRALCSGSRIATTLQGWRLDEVDADCAAATNAASSPSVTGWAVNLRTERCASCNARTSLAGSRPGYWQPAHFASASATLDRLTGGRLLINIVSGADNQMSYGDALVDSALRYDRTSEFVRLVRRLWAEEDVHFDGEFYRVRSASLTVRPAGFATGRLPTIYFGGASPAAERVAAAEADVQLFWGEPLDGVAERIARLSTLSGELRQDHAPLEFGLRVTTLIRETTGQAWHDAEEKVAKMAADAGAGALRIGRARSGAVGQQRLLALAQRGEVLDDCVYTTPGTFGGGGAGTTWLVGSATDVAQALEKYRELGVSHFVLSDTPYHGEIVRIGDHLLPLLRPVASSPAIRPPSRP